MQNDHSRSRLVTDDQPSPRKRKKAPPVAEVTAAEEAIGLRLREAYVDARSAFDTYLNGTLTRYTVPQLYDRGGGAVEVEGVVVEGKNAAPLWPKLARKFIALEIDPVEYTHCVFGYASDNHAKTAFGDHCPPEPNQLLSKTWLNYYRECELSDANGVLVKNALLNQASTAMREINFLHLCGKQTMLNSQYLVLLNPQLELSALFRYCLARELSEQNSEFDRIANLHERGAVIQFWSKRTQYLKHWRRLLPDDFVANARGLYTETFGKGT